MLRVLALFLLASCSTLQAGFTAFSGSYATAQAAFAAAAGEDNLGLETFESYANGQAVGTLAGQNAFFAPEFADGTFAPLPVIVSNSPVTSPRWVANFGSGRPAFSPWVIRPEAGFSIYAFGQANSQGDFVRIEAFDAQGNLVGSVDAPALSHAFAGFVSLVPVERVMVTPLGNFDGLNGMDNVQISTTAPIPEASALSLLAVGACALVVLMRSRRR